MGRTPDSEKPAGTYARHILDRLLVDLSWASSQLEGNTYSLLDTKRLIEHGQAAEGKDAAETQMILNHKAAIEFLVDSADDLAFNRQTILNLHALLSDNLLPDPGAGGRLRRIGVGINRKPRFVTELAYTNQSISADPPQPRPHGGVPLTQLLTLIYRF